MIVGNILLTILFLCLMQNPAACLPQRNGTLCLIFHLRWAVFILKLVFLLYVYVCFVGCISMYYVHAEPIEARSEFPATVALDGCQSC